MSTPAEQVRAHLVNLGLVSSAVQAGSAWTCLVGGLTDALAAPQVAVIDQGGMPPYQAYNAVPPSRPGVQLLVRGMPHTFSDTAQKARAIWSALRDAGAGNIMLLTPTTSPIWLGLDDSNRPQWSLNFLTITKEAN